MNTARKTRGNYYQQALKEVLREKARLAKVPDVIPSETMSREDSPQGRILHLLNHKMGTKARGVELYLQEIPAGGRSGKHRHMSEELVFVLSGKGHDLHWDVEVTMSERVEWKIDEKPRRFDWEEGDAVLIPVNTVHKHFNDDAEKPALIICATSPIYRYLGYHDLEQLEPCPEYKGKKE